MQNAAQYLTKTRSAAAKLFEGVNSYLAMLRDHHTTFVAPYSNDDDFQRQFDAWCKLNESKIQADLESQKRYLEESFAQATLCGAILQLAAKAIECYSKNTQVPQDWGSLIKPCSKPATFCIGRPVRGVLLGLVIYAGRNQHTHFEEQNLREPNLEVFRRLALDHGFDQGSRESFLDPAFHLGTASNISFANNITALMGWGTLEAYERDMRELLGI
jgi:hypothetical protein